MTLTHDLHGVQMSNGTHVDVDVVHPLDQAHTAYAAQKLIGLVDPSGSAHLCTDPHLGNGAANTLGSGEGQPTPATNSASVAPDPTPWAHLRNAVEAHEAAMEYRKAFDNRARAWGESKASSVARCSIHDHEVKLALNARHAYREFVPAQIREWQAATPGLGEQGLARLLGHLGDPSWKWVHEWQGEGAERTLVLIESSPRSFGQLVAYAGLVPGRKRSKGMSATDVARCGSPAVGPVLHSLAEAAGVKIQGPFREVYDAARAAYADHEDWTQLHQHNAALRIVKREILRGLWTVAQ